MMLLYLAQKNLRVRLELLIFEHSEIEITANSQNDAQNPNASEHVLVQKQ